MDGNWSYHVGLRSPNLTNTTVNLQENFEIDLEDTNWILTSAFIIFTMQTGFGMLESGCVSIKNEANIMMKNLADISLGGLTYWIFGYGMSFGEGPLSNPFIGVGNFLVDPPVGDALMGPVFASFLFQLSFATTATTIVSGAMAERCNFKAYCLFSFLNTIVYCVPAGWVWGNHGFLNKLGAVDIAGSGPVHLVGGASAFASALMLGPRLGRYARGPAPLPLGNPVNAVMGTFVLWWGWLAFNSGSTYGIQFNQEQRTRRCDGAYKQRSRISCFHYRSVDSYAFPWCHLVQGVIAVGLFADNPIPMDTTNGRSGLFKGGGWYLLGVQSLTGLCLATWGALVTMALLWLIDLVLPIRMEPYEELLGADLTEHRIRHGQVGISRAVSALRPYHRSSSVEGVGSIGVNTGHSLVVDKLQEIQNKKWKNKFSGKLQMFTNAGFVDETELGTFKNKGFLNKRPGNPENDLHRALDSMANEINGSQFKNSTKQNGILIRVIPEELKGKKFKELSASELEELACPGEMNASEDRFRYRFTEEDYIDDVERSRSASATVRWID
ncbi:jg293 [Pararge aegeria aegeria]|uniref:Jg293 protein n=1 Tax=Pararge aegeria aegeria TaxID=348720 RepID=A0A8S4S4B5_9NEOP|nr:jg293 [Pararge aegeria aegeria]